MKDEKEYLELVDHYCGDAVEEFAAAIGDTKLQRRAICRYFKKGCAAGISTAELVDFLGVCSPSILDRAGYADSEALVVMEILSEVSDEEIEREPI